ncbi:hypothetical protein Taro_053594 [Colocasia esculenta]|uniref:Uncharacterized protein n=1 Tax=Colocasia esculenta TaxID=4460 RepID=A0A843XN24_COLES|nr:hypothetical protein [Colocasia esculenta]
MLSDAGRRQTTNWDDEIKDRPYRRDQEIVVTGRLLLSDDSATQPIPRGPPSSAPADDTC